LSTALSGMRTWRPVAGVIVDDEGRALIIQRRDNGQWEPPGGILEHGETVDEGLRREVLEETGLVVEPGRLSGIYQNMQRNIVALVLRCRPVGGRLATTSESADFGGLPKTKHSPS
jgi:8-oxo-dGTP diphosphatase